MAIHYYFAGVCAQSLQSRLTLCDPMDCSQAPLSTDSPGTNTDLGRDQIASPAAPALQAVFTAEPPGKPHYYFRRITMIRINVIQPGTLLSTLFISGTVLRTLPHLILDHNSSP